MPYFRYKPHCITHFSLNYIQYRVCWEIFDRKTFFLFLSSDSLHCSFSLSLSWFANNNLCHTIMVFVQNSIAFFLIRKQSYRNLFSLFWFTTTNLPVRRSSTVQCNDDATIEQSLLSILRTNRFWFVVPNQINKHNVFSLTNVYFALKIPVAVSNILAALASNRTEIIFLRCNNKQPY